MNPLVSAALGSILRWLLALGAGYLVKAGVWSGSDAETYVTAAVVALLALGWSQYQNFVNRRKLVTALSMPATTEAHVERIIADGEPVPSTTTPKTYYPIAGR